MRREYEEYKKALECVRTDLQELTGYRAADDTSTDVLADAIHAVDSELGRVDESLAACIREDAEEARGDAMYERMIDRDIAEGWGR